MISQQARTELGQLLSDRVDHELWSSFLRASDDDDLREAYLNYQLKRFPAWRQLTPGWEKHIRNHINKLPSADLHKLADPLFPELFI